MDVIEYRTEYGQNALGMKTGNRVKRRGIYKCSSCGEAVTVWSDYGRLPACFRCKQKVEWESAGEPDLP